MWQVNRFRHALNQSTLLRSESITLRRVFLERSFHILINDYLFWKKYAFVVLPNEFNYYDSEML